MSDAVLVEQDGPVTIITINRPEKRNAVDGPTALALRNAFNEFSESADAKVAVLTGAGGNFCAGADLSAIGSDNGNIIEASGTAAGPMGPTRTPIDKPVIAAVSGYAVAGGLELALYCDLRVGDPSAVFGVFCRRWGVPLIDGGTIRLPRLIGQGRALDMILTGREVDAAEALQIGLADRITEPGRALAEAVKLGRQIAGFPQACMRADRRSVYAQWSESEATALVREGAGGYPVVAAEGVHGARRFAAGAGRHGQPESDIT
ncbi:MAG: crotonase/enoyl-CoA hydratase family protein [Burkholderiaceae bacterium]